MEEENTGSSPRMRGTLDIRLIIDRTDRFIPAHAGNTSCICAIDCCKAVHPRACGEHTLLMHSSCSNVGSSPRMRGTPPVRT